jgi:hypothetical protein
MKFTAVAAAAVLGCSALGASAAHAAVLLFTLTGAVDAQFTLDSDPLPSQFASGLELKFDSVDVNIAGTSKDISVLFYGPLESGGISLFDESTNPTTEYLNTEGPVLYSGSENAPSFAPGIFDMSSGGGNEILAISAVPEPASWALMIVGIAGLGAALRSTRFRRYPAAI